MRVSRASFLIWTVVLAASCGDDSGTGTESELRAPAGLSASAIDDSRVALRWRDRNAAETAFRIERAPSGSSAWAQVGQRERGDTTFLDSGLEPLTDYVYRVRAEAAGRTSEYSNVAGVTTRAVIPRVTTSTDLPDGLVGAPYQVALEASGGDGHFLWSLYSGELPEGLTLDPTSGAIHGTPTVAGYSTFLVRVSSAGLSSLKRLTLDVEPPLMLVDLIIPLAVNTPVSRVLQAEGGAGSRVWSVVSGALPDGLTLEPSGRLEGSVSDTVTSAVTLRVESEDGQVVEEAVDFEFTIVPLEIAVDALALGRLGSSYVGVIEAIGGRGSYTWQLGGPLPDGLVLDGAAGRVEGVAATEGRTVLDVSVRDEDGRSASGDVAIRICSAIPDPAVGGTLTYEFPGDGCGLVLPGGGAEYRIGVMPRFIQSGADPVVGGVRVRARASDANGQLLRTPVGGTSALRVDVGAGLRSEIDPELTALIEATEELHHLLREEELATVPNVASPRPAVLGPPVSAARAEAIATQAPAPQRTFFVRDPSTRVRSPISATLRGTGAGILYYEDDGVGESRATDAEVQAVIDYYDTYGHPIIQDAFGGFGPAGTTNMFRRDGQPALLPASDIDENGGRFVFLQVRPELMLNGAAAYVSSCDRRPRPENYQAGPFTCAGSNEAEITYVRRPSSAFYLGSTVHEAKHISSHGYAIFGERGFNRSWIEEGTAEIAKEKSSRDASGIPDGAEADYADVYRGGSHDGPPVPGYGMHTVNSRARRYLRASPISGLVGNPSPNPLRSTYYGASWLFHRFLVDNYGDGDEDAFLRAMNTGATSGVARIEEVTGRSLDALLTEFLQAIAVEGVPAAEAASTRSFATYDLTDVGKFFAGVWPYADIRSGFEDGDWLLGDVQYTSANFIEIVGSGSETLWLDLTDASGGQLFEGDRVVMTVVRVR